MVSNENFGSTSPARGGSQDLQEKHQHEGRQAQRHDGRPTSTAARWHATTITSTSTKVEIAWLSEVKLTGLGPPRAGGTYKFGGGGAPI